MWLPVILVRHFGWPGWVAFAVPNIAGAMSVGLVYRTRAQSSEFVARRLPTMRAFSKVTLALHAFVLTWALSLLMGGLTTIAGLPAAIPGTAVPLSTVLALLTLAALWFSASWFGKRSFRAACIAAIVIWLSSAYFLAMSWTTTPGFRAPPQFSGDARGVDLFFLAPVLVFAFALCPYLDLTIHRARQETPGAAGTRAFVLGFGVLFTAMIAGTLLYAQGWIDSRSYSFYVIAHLTAQSWFTIGMHQRALRDTAGADRRSTATPLLVGMALGLAPASAFVGSVFGGTALQGVISFDGFYRMFMAFYGLVFPALLWVWTTSRRDDRAATLTALIAIALALPFFWLGFFEGRWIYLPAGLLIVLVAGPLATRFSSPKGAAEEAKPGPIA
jgi:hypothetical protein